MTEPGGGSPEAPEAVADAPAGPSDAAPDAPSEAPAAGPDRERQVVAPPPPAPSADGATRRHCRTCGGRVPVAADGRHCHAGHRLSPAHAHADAPRRGLLRRLFRRG